MRECKPEAESVRRHFATVGLLCASMLGIGKPNGMLAIDSRSALVPRRRVVCHVMSVTSSLTGIGAFPCLRGAWDCFHQASEMIRARAYYQHRSRRFRRTILPPDRKLILPVYLGVVNAPHPPAPLLQLNRPVLQDKKRVSVDCVYIDVPTHSHAHSEVQKPFNENGTALRNAPHKKIIQI